MPVDPMTTNRHGPLIAEGGAGIRMLYAASDASVAGALRQAFAEAGPGEAEVLPAAGAAEAIGRLTEDLFDTALLHHTPEFDACSLAQAARSAGCDTPLIVLGDQPPGDFEADCLAAGADAYRRLSQTTPRTLLAVVRRAIDQARTAREFRRLADAERRRLATDHLEAEHLLGEQRRLVDQLEALGAGAGPLVAPAPESDPGQLAATAALGDDYRELIQAYVIMSAGQLSTELTAMANRLVAAGVSGRQAATLHVSQLQRVVRSLGARSARHVMNRADLLLVELLVHLADGYRHRYDSSATRQAG